MTVVLFGCGVMGQILLKGLIESGEEIVAVDFLPVIEKISKEYSGAKLSFATDAKEVLSKHPRAEIVLAVKPFQVDSFLSDLETISPLIISIVAGREIQAFGPRQANIVRIMTNTSARLQSAPIVLCSQKKPLIERASYLLRNLGEIIVLEDESKFDSVTCLIGSAPALALEMIEGLALGGVRQGLTRELSLKLAAYALLGATQLVLQEGTAPSSLRDQICTPGGCTVAGIESLEHDAFRGIVMRALQAIKNKLQL